MDRGEDERSDDGLANEFFSRVDEVEGGVGPQKYSEGLAIGGCERGGEDSRKEL